MYKIDPVKLSQDLIRCPSVTPQEAGSLDVLERELNTLGFKCQRVTFSAEGTDDVDNLYARYGTDAPNLCFAGHTDVVPVGDIAGWDHDPFAAEIVDGVLYGRGAVDMKCAIAAFVSAAANIIATKKFAGSISFLITCDEEGPAINGTRKMLDWLVENNEKLDACIVGEPTNPNKLGEMVKNGRRGSVTFDLTVNGVQGHVAYPDLALNPSKIMINILSQLACHMLDDGNEAFQASNLEVTSIDTGNETTNVIPANVSAKFNIRFNNIHSSESLINWADNICQECCSNPKSSYQLNHRVTGEAFLTEPGMLTDIMLKNINKVTGIKPVLSTTGGTSDARFIKNHCPVVEFGLINQTAHKVNENIPTKDIEQLSDIYYHILLDFLNVD